MNWEVWGPPLAVIGLGLVAAVVVVMRSSGRSPSSGSVDRLTREDLETRKDALVEQLRALQTERSKLSPEEFASRWQVTLDRAATSLRDLENFDSLPADPITEEFIAASGGGPMLARAGWAAAVVVFFLVLGLTLTEASRPRGADGTMTGATVDSRVAAIEDAQAALEADPSDIDAAALLAHTAIRSGDLEAGMRYVEAGRNASPDDPRIQASLAALMIAIGSFDKADEVLTGVHAAAPDLGAGWLWRGVLESSRGNREGAEVALTKVIELSDSPDDKRIAAMLIADLDTPEPQVRVKGWVQLADGATAPPDALVFVYARRAAEGRGPPVAALKLSAAQLPLEFSLGDSDIVMQGSPWPDQVWLSARVDLDGNAMTREEGAPVSVPVGPLGADAEPVTLVLTTAAATP